MLIIPAGIELSDSIVKLVFIPSDTDQVMHLIMWAIGEDAPLGLISVRVGGMSSCPVAHIEYCLFDRFRIRKFWRRSLCMLESYLQSNGICRLAVWVRDENKGAAFILKHEGYVPADAAIIGAQPHKSFAKDL